MAVGKIVLKWTNKFSGETGYVKSFSKKDGHFVNTYEASEARGFLNKTVASKMITDLEAAGEAENNIFEVVAV